METETQKQKQVILQAANLKQEMPLFCKVEQREEPGGGNSTTRYTTALLLLLKVGQNCVWFCSNNCSSEIYLYAEVAEVQYMALQSQLYTKKHIYDKRVWESMSQPIVQEYY